MAEKTLERLKTSLANPEGTKRLSPLLLKRLKGLVQFTDLRLQLVKELLPLLKENAGKETSEIWMKNVLSIIAVLTLRKNFESERFQSDDDPETSQTPEENYAEFKKRFSLVWAEVMKWKMNSPSVLKEVVIITPEKVMPHLTKPLHMSHFLLESFKLGGPVSLLSLQGIFILMQQYNFDVPDFYTKLYSMFTQEVLYSKYRARFFAYSRDFLTSTHLPEYLVAAFVKRMARLSLHAPAPVIPVIFDFITNLMIDHPGLKTLVNKKPTTPTDLPPSAVEYDRDPFLEDEPDPIKSRAMDSCLWEIKTLQSHILPNIATRAKFISKALPKVEKDLDEVLSMDYDDVYLQEKEAITKMGLTPLDVTELFVGMGDEEDDDDIE